MSEIPKTNIQGQAQFKDILSNPQWMSAFKAAASMGSVAVIGPNEQPAPEMPAVEVRHSPRMR